MIKRAMVLFLSLSILSGCRCPYTSKGLAGDNKPIRVKPGESFVLMLESNPTTGYSWQLAGKLDEKLIKFIKNRFIAPSTRLIGAGGKEFWSFKALTKGEAVISLEYVRPWEKDKPAARREIFRVLIR